MSFAIQRVAAPRVGASATVRRDSRTPSVRVRAAASLDVVKMSPLGDRVLVRPKAKEEKSAGGVILTGSSASEGQFGRGDQVLTGTVVRVGEEADVDVSPGDMIMFTKLGSSDIETDDGSVSFVAQRSILAKLS
jgi:chaperonin GroES